jgi:hypothetical protein
MIYIQIIVRSDVLIMRYGPYDMDHILWSRHLIYLTFYVCTVYVTFCSHFSNWDNLLSANENDQFWQIPTSFPDWTNQNDEIQIYPNWKNGSKNVTYCMLNFRSWWLVENLYFHSKSILKLSQNIFLHEFCHTWFLSAFLEKSKSDMNKKNDRARAPRYKLYRITLTISDLWTHGT